jgi:thiamine-monophosphate kinase
VRLRDRGEFAWIERIRRRVARGKVSRDVALGIGDDAALLRLRRGEQVAVSTDAFVEDVHFRFASEAPHTIGRRAVVAALSDLAAMGARPLSCIASLAAPPTLSQARFDGLMAGVVDEAGRYGAPLSGGNLTRAREVSLHLTALGAVAAGRALTRTGVRVGDRVLVTGTLGSSALERARAERGKGRVRRVPEPRLAAGRKLAGVRGVVACIDISDGLEADLAHLLPDGLGLPLDPGVLPLPRGFRARCARAGLDGDALALRGGEDYELLFAIRGARPPAEMLSRRLGVPVTELGRVERVRAPATRRQARPGGWRHF